MAFQLEVWIDGHSRDRAALLSRWLTSTGRPDFEDEVDEEDLPAFEAVQRVDFANETLASGRWLFGYWFDGKTELQDVFVFTQAARVSIVGAYVAPTDADTADEVEDDTDPMQGYYFLRIDGKLQRITRALLESRFPGHQHPPLLFEGYSKNLQALCRLAGYLDS